MVEYVVTLNMPYSEFLFRLLEAEIVKRQERSIQTLIKVQTAVSQDDPYVFTAQPSVDERRIRELLTLSFIDRKENILFLGPPGIGKTHLAISIGMEAIARGYKTYFITAHDLVNQLRRADQEGKLEKKLRVFVKPTVLIIDEMGYLKLDPNSAHYLFQVIARRYEHSQQKLWGMGRNRGRLGRC
ncbi:ATP-binding protein [Geobacillus stearothermophilus]|uniref:ATP-binding protein n=1 Tax=Geobacillus stearothermophilus TaxID=1422 RepID=UPI002E1EF709|nr:ATP-binding protein [Geobacillus stearothermophilus]MED3724535.1 ATP-binding protein [Geobacillus stearothermophilus]